MGAMATGSADWQPTRTVAGSQAVIPPSTRGVRNTASSAARFAARVTSPSLPPATKSRMSAGRIRAAASSASRTHSKDSAICGNALPSAGPGLIRTRRHVPAGTRNSPWHRRYRPPRAVMAGSHGGPRHEPLARVLRDLEHRRAGTLAAFDHAEPDALGVHDGVGEAGSGVDPGRIELGCAAHDAL